MAPSCEAALTHPSTPTIPDEAKQSFAELESRNARQEATLNWAIKIFTYDVAGKPLQRAVRFYEEATELVQSVYDAEIFSGDLDPSKRLHRAIWRYRRWKHRRMVRRKMVEVVDYVLARPPGIVGQEIGGTMVTLMGLAEITGHSVALEEYREFTRCHQPEVIERILEKQKKKIHE